MKPYINYYYYYYYLPYIDFFSQLVKGIIQWGLKVIAKSPIHHLLHQAGSLATTLMQLG